MDVESIVIDHIEGKRKNAFLLSLLFVLSLGYKIAIKTRNFFYDYLFLPCKPPAKIISIGNIVAGGSGKTPMTRYLAEQLSTIPTAVLTRGYLSKIEKSGNSICLSGKETDPIAYGDEPLVLMNQLPNAKIWIGKHRDLSARLAVREGAKVLILEDGMQVRRLHKDLEIVMMNPKDLWGKGYYLPRGYLRDEPRRLKKASAIVLLPVYDEDTYIRSQEELKKWTDAPVFGGKMIPQNLSLQESRVGVFCGLANPERFLEMLRNEKISIVGSLFSKDHEAPSREDLQVFADECKSKGAQMLLCTEKDKIKIGFNISFPILAVDAKLNITYGKEKFDIMLEQFISGI